MKKLAIALVLVMAISAPAFAECAINEWANSSNYWQKAPGMITRGAMNIVTSPIDFVAGVVNEFREDPQWYSPVTGLVRGTQDTLDRAGRGAVDVAGSIFPNFNGFPNYKPCPMSGKQMWGSETTTAAAAK